MPRKLFFYGDSLTSGENNGFNSFVDKLTGLTTEFNVNIIKSGVSGSTIGEYSLYPVFESSLISRLYRDVSSQALLSDASHPIIFLEFGINDVSSVCAGRVDINTVFIELRKCLDFIHQNTESAYVVFLTVGDDDRTLRCVAKSQVQYLDEYYKGLIPFSANIWVDAYKSVIEFAGMFCDKVCPMFLSGQDFKEVLDRDNIHPNDAGYALIASNILSFIQEVNYGFETEDAEVARNAE